MPAGSTMAAIQDRGRLVVGVSADTLQFGARNPIINQIEGFDIDILKEVAKAIFGDDDPSNIEYRIITYAAAPSGAGGRRGRPRRPHDDDQLQPLAAHRLLVHLLRRRPEGAGRAGLGVRQHR